MLTCQTKVFYIPQTEIHVLTDKSASDNMQITIGGLELPAGSSPEEGRECS